MKDGITRIVNGLAERPTQPEENAGGFARRAAEGAEKLKTGGSQGFSSD
jgi:hypothetical protein